MPATQNAAGVKEPTRVAATAAITTAEISGAVTPSDCAIRPGRPTALRLSPRPSSCPEASMSPPRNDSEAAAGLRPASRCEITSHMAGRVSSLREALREGRRLRGTFVKLPAPEVVEIAADVLDFAIVDLEHSQLAEAEALRLVRHAWARRFPALLRVHELDRSLVNRVLEAGAAGIQLSSVRSAAEVRALRDACLYAPEGTRSISLAHGPARYGALSLADYLAALEPPILVVQIETAETEDPLEAILGAGADIVFVGVAEVVAAAALAGVAFGGFGDDERFRYAVASSDLALLRKAYADG